MNSLKRASEILPLLIELKDCIIKENNKSGKIVISQDLLNVTLKKLILSKLDNLDDFKCDFYTDEIKLIKKVFFLPLSLKLHSFQFVLGKEEYKIIAKHNSVNVFKLIEFFGPLPSFCSATKDEFVLDLTKIDGFFKLKNEGLFGIDIFNSVEIKFMNCENGTINFSYRFID